MPRFVGGKQRGLNDAIRDLNDNDKALREGRGATHDNIRREKRRIYEFLKKQGVPVDDVIYNNKRRKQ